MKGFSETNNATFNILKNSSGWWLTYPSENYYTVSWDHSGSLFPIYGNKKNLPNHQPVIIGFVGNFRTLMH